MSLYLEVISGEGRGNTFPVNVGDVLGRGSCSISISDKKISSNHAKIELAPQGQLVLVDLGSSNGLIINGQKVRRLALLPGVIFQIGRTVLQVCAGSPHKEQETKAMYRSWREVLAWEARKLSIEENFPNQNIAAFSPSLQLNFISGPQMDEELVLGWGPRVFGANTLDISLLDPNLPDIAFSISPDPAGAKIQTDYPDLLLINQIPTQSSILHERDLINVGHTQIEVHYK